MSESRGIDIKLQDDTSLTFVAVLFDNTNAKVTTGDTELRLFHLVPSTGAMEAYDWSDHTFKTGVLTTDHVDAVHRVVNNAGYNTGDWTYRLSTLTGFVNGDQYIEEFYNASAWPSWSQRWFQYGTGNRGWSIAPWVFTPAGGYTFQELKNELLLIIRRTWPGQSDLVNDLLLNKWINSAYQEVDRMLQWSRGTYAITTTAAEEAYDIPTNVRVYTLVEYVHSDNTIVKLAEIDLEAYLDKRVTSTASGVPLYWCHHGDQFYLYPPPDLTNETVTIWAILEPANLADDDDKPGFPAHLHPLIIDMGLAYAFRYFGEEEASIATRQAVDTRIQRERLENPVQRQGGNRIISTGL